MVFPLEFASYVGGLGVGLVFLHNDDIRTASGWKQSREKDALTKVGGSST